MLETRLSEVLASGGSVLVGFSARSVSEAIPLLMTPALSRAAVPGERQQSILQAIEKREEGASTVSPPLALPHARCAGVDRIVAGLGINRSGALEERSGVNAVVSFVSPETASAEHLRFLSGVAKLFRSPASVEELLAAQSSEELVEILRRLGH